MRLFRYCPEVSRLAVIDWPWMLLIVAIPMGFMFLVREYLIRERAMDPLSATVRGGLFAVGAINIILLLFLLVASDFIYRVADLRRAQQRAKEE